MCLRRRRGPVPTPTLATLGQIGYRRQLGLTDPFRRGFQLDVISLLPQGSVRLYQTNINFDCKKLPKEIGSVIRSVKDMQ